jgi:hypothetical protein
MVIREIVWCWFRVLTSVMLCLQTMQVSLWTLKEKWRVSDAFFSLVSYLKGGSLGNDPGVISGYVPCQLRHIFLKLEVCSKRYFSSTIHWRPIRQIKFKGLDLTSYCCPNEVIFSVSCAGSAITGPIGKECADLWPRIASAANAIVWGRDSCASLTSVKMIFLLLSLAAASTNSLQSLTSCSYLMLQFAGFATG